MTVRNLPNLNNWYNFFIDLFSLPSDGLQMDESLDFSLKMMDSSFASTEPCDGVGRLVNQTQVKVFCCFDV